MKTAEIIWFDVHSNTMTRVGWCVTTFGSPRRQRVRQILAAADCDWVQDYATQRDCTDGKRGCFCAHVAAIAHAFEDDACDVVWMFEDDVAFEDFRASVGAGLRVSVPALGPVPLAFDWAVPIVDQDTDDRQIFSFYIGVNR